MFDFQPFYKQEVLLTTMHDTSPLVGIVGKCSVLDYDDYLKCEYLFPYFILAYL